MKKLMLILATFVVHRADAQVAQPAASAEALADRSHVFFEFQVDRAVEKLRPSPKAEYPQSLKSTGAEAEVQVQYIVDTLGVADVESFKVLKSPNELFSNAVRNVLPKTRFTPAILKGRKVKQLVAERVFFAPPK